ncbi:flavin reductase [Acuticoccus sp.]|uniref:flavin reductase n=1 Tax=Acuticoccus sp. TaxID=1904378 RepID=UPI003B5292F6
MNGEPLRAEAPSERASETPVEAGDPRDDGRAFRRCLGQFATGVTVVAAAADGRATGVTANSFASVSMDPPLILWSLKRQSDSLAIFQAASHFAVNILASDQSDVASHFARSGEKFASVGFAAGAGGAPLLSGVAAQLECRRHAEHDGGDHVIMVGHVERYRRFDRPLLLFSQGHYGLAVEHPGSGPAPEPRPTAAPMMKPLLSNLMRRALVGFTAALQEALASLGMTTNESRMIATISYFPGSKLETLAEAGFLGTVAAEDAAESLVRKGFVTRDGDGGFTVTEEGLSEVHAIRREALACEAQLLHGMSQGDIDTTRRVLEALASHARSPS